MASLRISSVQRSLRITKNEMLINKTNLTNIHVNLDKACNSSSILDPSGNRPPSTARAPASCEFSTDTREAWRTLSSHAISAIMCSRKLVNSLVTREIPTPMKHASTVSLRRVISRRTSTPVKKSGPSVLTYKSV